MATNPTNMVQFVSPKHFYESLLPIFTYSTIVGIFPMFPSRIAGKYVLYSSKKLHIITLSFLLIYSACFGMTIIKRSNNVVGQKFYKEQNKVSNLGLTLGFIFGVVLLYIIYLMSFVKTKDVKDVMVNINKVDELLKKMGSRMQYQYTFWYQVIIIFSGIAMVLLISSMQLVNIKIENFRPISLNMWILLVYPMVLLYNMNSQFGLTAILIYQRFKMINEELEKIKSELRKNKTGIKIESKISTLGKIHQALCDAAKKTNTNYNIQMVPSLAQQFFLTLYTIFYYYWMVSSKPFSASCWLAWGFLKTYEILQVAISCHLASEEAETVGRKIHKVLIYARNARIEDKLLSFSQQVRHGNFRFTLCGLFKIDAGLLFNMIGSSTTFIVIMIQFQESATPSNCVSKKSSFSIEP